MVRPAIIHLSVVYMGLCSMLACSAAEQSATADKAASLNLSSAAIFQQINTLSSSDRSSIAAAASRTSMLEYYEGLVKEATDNPVNVDGYTFSGALANLRSQRRYYESLSETYPTLASYWKAINFDPMAAVSESDLTLAITSLRKAASATVGLALADPSCAIASSANLRELSTLPVVGSRATPSTAVATPDLGSLPAGQDYYTAYRGNLQGNLYIAAANPSSAQDYRDKHTALLDTVANITNPKSSGNYGGTLPDGTRLYQCYPVNGTDPTSYITTWGSSTQPAKSNIVVYSPDGNVTSSYADHTGTETLPRAIITDPNGANTVSYP